MKNIMLIALTGYAVYTLPFWVDMIGKVCGGIVAALICWMYLFNANMKKSKK